MEEKLKEILYEVCEDERVYDEGIDLLEEVIDSMGLIELFSRLEEEFSIEIQPTEVPVDSLRTVEKLTEFIEGKISGNGKE